jgi:hypothetical protein
LTEGQRTAQNAGVNRTFFRRAGWVTAYLVSTALMIAVIGFTLIAFMLWFFMRGMTAGD